MNRGFEVLLDKQTHFEFSKVKANKKQRKREFINF